MTIVINSLLIPYVWGMASLAAESQSHEKLIIPPGSGYNDCAIYGESAYGKGSVPAAPGADKPPVVFSESSVTVPPAVDSLAPVFSDSMDLYDRRLRTLSDTRFALHQLPENMDEWERYRTQLRERIVEKF